jgi:hypothetical protein
MQDVGSTRARSDVLAEIFARIAAGESVTAICKSGGKFPTDRTFWRWLQDDPTALECYEKATTARAHVYAERIQDVTAELKRDDDLTSEKVQLAKLESDNLKWNASRMLPRKYGDRTVIAGDADNPLSVELSDAKASLLRGITPKPDDGGAPGEG